MPSAKRVHYFDHQFLVEADFTDEQKYHLDMRRLHNRLLHTFGIAQGLEVEKTGDNEITIRPGMAIDRDGREIVLSETPLILPAKPATNPVIQINFPAGSEIYITVAYDETPTDPSLATGVTGDTRTTEAPIFAAVITPIPPTDGSVLRLSRFTLDAATGNVPGNIGDLLDGGVRQSVSGQIAAQSVGTNELADGAVVMNKLATPVQDIINAPKGLASIDGISNPGGDVDLLAGTGIAITPDNATKKITIAAAGTQGLVSIDGVSSPGGDVDLVPAGAVTISADNIGKKITISENHSTLTNNPHNVTAAQINALLATDYDLRQRAVRPVLFSGGSSVPGGGDDNGAKRTVTAGFQPKVVLVVGTVTCNFLNLPKPAKNYGGGISAFADMTAGMPGTRRCFGFGITRASDTDWLCRGLKAENICTSVLTFNDSGGIPQLQEILNVDISSLSNTGLEITLSRTRLPGTGPQDLYKIELELLCFG